MIYPRLLLLLFFLLTLSSCFISREKPVGEKDMFFRKISYKEVANWGKDNKGNEFLGAFTNTCNLFNKRADTYKVTTKPVVTTL